MTNNLQAQRKTKEVNRSNAISKTPIILDVIKKLCKDIEGRVRGKYEEIMGYYPPGETK